MCRSVVGDVVVVAGIGHGVVPVDLLAGVLAAVLPGRRAAKVDVLRALAAE
jgi:hypothetical protein